MLRNELNARQKRYLKSLSANISPVIQIGKAGVTPTLAATAADALRARELIKVKVLQNCPEDKTKMIELLAERLDANLVQLIGRNGILYKRNFDKPQIELP